MWGVCVGGVACVLGHGVFLVMAMALMVKAPPPTTTPTSTHTHACAVPRCACSPALDLVLDQGHGLHGEGLPLGLLHLRPHLINHCIYGVGWGVGGVEFA